MTVFMRKNNYALKISPTSGKGSGSKGVKVNNIRASQLKKTTPGPHNFRKQSCFCANEDGVISSVFMLSCCHVSEP